MIGAIIGDIVGSRFEFVEDRNRGKDFALFASGCRFTDDSLMTLAVAKSLFLSKDNYDNLGKLTTQVMKDIAKPYPRIGWGAMFYKWLFERSVPYNSYGNGADMDYLCEKAKEFAIKRVLNNLESERMLYAQDFEKAFKTIKTSVLDADRIEMEKFIKNYGAEV